MNQIVSLNTASTLTMSSREIAKLTGKRHDHVMRDIRSMLAGLDITHPNFGGSYVDTTGRSLACFHLPKRETLILVSGYSVELHARIIDRWMELEAQVQPQAISATEVAMLMAQYMATILSAGARRIRQGSEKVNRNRLLPSPGIRKAPDGGSVLAVVNDLDLFLLVVENKRDQPVSAQFGMREGKGLSSTGGFDLHGTVLGIVSVDGFEGPGLDQREIKKLSSHGLTQVTDKIAIESEMQIVVLIPPPQQISCVN